MALQDPQAEPSMEEILASIRRIISEEEGGAPAAEADVLDLTQEAAPAPVAQADTQDDIVFDELPEPEPELAPQPVAQAEPPPPRPAPAPAPMPVAAVTPDAIISPPTASAAAGALARLSSTLRVSDTPGQTVEGVVRELLKPMLREWLDQNLPAIVESRVEAELERIARMSR